MKKSIFLLLTALAFLFSGEVRSEEDISVLLKKYEEEADLSKKTKEESLGHVIVFTRKDLEIMNAHTLSDVLRLIPLNNLLPNSFGVETLLNPGRPPTVPFVYRLYIDDHEVSSIHTYSPFLIYDRYNLDNIDHIEIYYSAGAISVSNEPSQMIIKLYTKMPKRENASKLRTTVGTKKSYTLSFFSANKINDYSCYLITFSKSYFTFPKAVVSGQKINRNQIRKNLFLKYGYMDTLLEFSAQDVKRGGFMGRSVDYAPDFSSTYSLDTYIVLTQKLPDNIKLVASYDYQKRKYKEQNSKSDGGIFIPSIYKPSNPPVFYYEDLNFHKLALSVEKKFSSKKNNLLLGTFLRYYMQDVSKKYYINETGKQDITDTAFNIKNFYIGSFYAENSFNIDEKNLLIAGIKHDKYKFYGQKSKNRINTRLGFISFLDHKLMLKAFLAHYYVIPAMIVIESSKNKKLNPMPSTVFTGEVKYQIGKNELRLFYEYYRIRDLIIFDRAAGGFINSDKNGNFHGYGLFFKRKLGNFTNIQLNYWITDVGKDKFTPERGGYLRLGGEFDRFNLYSEVVYRGSYKPYGMKIRESFNMKLALGINLPSDWHFKLIGENLLNQSEKEAYLNMLGEKGAFSTYYKRIIITLEKVF